MTDGAVLDVGSRRLSMPHAPEKGRVIERHATFTFMAAVTETSRVVTTSTLSLPTLRIQTVREEIIQIVNVAGEVVAPMTLQTSGLMPVTADAVTALKGCSVAVLVSPIIGMNIGQGDQSSMTDRAIIVRFGTIMALKTDSHFWKVSFAGSLARCKPDVTASTLGSSGDMFFMVEQNRTFRIGQFFRLIGIAMAPLAGFVIFDVVAGAALVHCW